MSQPREKPNAFVVNDSIYVLSSHEMTQSAIAGERYLLKENKWKSFEAKNSESQKWLNNGPAALLYE